MNTLRYIFSVTVGLATLGLAGAALAQDNVTGTKHDLTLVANTVHQTSTAQICVFCHTPHAASLTAQPLWNRDASVPAYQMYNSTWSSTIDMTVAGTPQGVSLACLSCHDGTVALDAFQNAPGPGGGVAGSEGYTFFNAGPGNVFPPASFAMLGPDLTNDHPISVTYDNTVTGDTAFRDPATFTNVQLANNAVECSSCHNPHNNSNGLFLRGSNAASALCLECHIK